MLWVALVFTSVLFLPLALWCNFSLARVAQLDPYTNTVWLGLLSVVVTLALPMGLSAWKHGGDPRRLWATAAWLPLCIANL